MCVCLCDLCCVFLLFLIPFLHSFVSLFIHLSFPLSLIHFFVSFSLSFCLPCSVFAPLYNFFLHSSLFLLLLKALFSIFPCLFPFFFPSCSFFLNFGFVFRFPSFFHPSPHSSVSLCGFMLTFFFFLFIPFFIPLWFCFVLWFCGSFFLLSFLPSFLRVYLSFSPLCSSQCLHVAQWPLFPLLPALSVNGSDVKRASMCWYVSLSLSSLWYSSGVPCSSGVDGNLSITSALVPFYPPAARTSLGSSAPWVTMKPPR